MPRLTKKARRDREQIAEDFAQFAIDADGSFANVNVIGAPEHEAGGSIWVTVRVLVADLTIEERLTRKAT